MVAIANISRGIYPDSLNTNDGGPRMKICIDLTGSDFSHVETFSYDVFWPDSILLS